MGLVGLCVKIFDAPTRRRDWIVMMALTVVDVLLSLGSGIMIVVSLTACLTVPLGAWVARTCLRAGVGRGWKVAAVGLTVFNLLLGLLGNPAPFGILRTLLSAPGMLCGWIVIVGLIALAAHRLKQPRKARAALP